MLSVMGKKGPESISVGNVSLVTMSGVESIRNGTVTDIGDGTILVSVDEVPEGEFIVLLQATDKVSDSQLQRQSTTQMSLSKVTIQVGASPHICSTHWILPMHLLCILTNACFFWATGGGGQKRRARKNLYAPVQRDDQRPWRYILHCCQK